jgi:hypothetical protein
MSKDCDNSNDFRFLVLSKDLRFFNVESLSMMEMDEEEERRRRRRRMR